MRRKRYAALFMAAVTACTQVAGTGVVAIADEIIVEAEPQEYAGEADGTALDADMQQADETAVLAAEPLGEDTALAGQAAEETAVPAKQPDAEIPAAVNDAAEHQASEDTPSGEMDAAAAGTVTEAPSAGEAAPDMADETPEPDDDMLPADGDIAAEPNDAVVPADGDPAAEPDDAMLPTDGATAAEPDDAVAPADGAIAAEPDGTVTAEQPDDVLLADELNIDGSDLLMSVEEVDGAAMAELDLAAEGEEGGEEQSISLTELRDQDHTHTWIYNNEDLSLGVNTDGLSLTEGNVVLEWSVDVRTLEQAWENDQYNRNLGPDSGVYTVSEDETQITLHGEALAAQELNENEFITVMVTAFLQEGNEDGSDQRLANAWASLEIREPWYAYDYPGSEPGDAEIKIHDTYTVNDTIWCNYEDATEPYGAGRDVLVKNISILRHKVWNDERQGWDDSETPVVSIDEDGRTIIGEGFGCADIEIVHESAEDPNETVTDTFELFVGGDVYDLICSPSNNVNMLTSDECSISTKLYHEWRDEDWNEGWEYTEDYKLSVTEDDGTPVYDSEYLDVAVGEDEKSLTVKSKDLENGGITINVRVMMPEIDEDGSATGKWFECTRRNIYVNLTQGYDVLESDSPDEVLVGGSLDFNDLNARVMTYWYDENAARQGEERADVTYRAEYDGNAWEVVDRENGGLPVLKRIGNWPTWVNLIAEDTTDGNEICRKDYYFGNLNYDIWFDGENIRNENGDGTWIYNTEDLVLNVNTENLADKQSADIELTYEYKVGICEDGRDDYVRELSGAVLTADGSSVTLHGAQIWQELAGTELSENQWTDVSLQVYANGVWAASCALGLDVREPSYDYQCPDGGVSMLPGWDHWVDSSFNCYVENEEYPYGENQNVTVTDVTVANAEDEESELPVCMIDGSDENGWNIHASQNTCGHAVATVTYELVDGSGDSGSYEFDIWVGGDVFSMNLWSDCVSDQLLPGESLQMTAQVRHDYYDNEIGHNSGDVDEEELGASVEIEWLLSVDSGRPNQNEDGSVTWYDYTDDGTEYPVLTLVPGEDGRTCTVTAAEMLPEEWGDYGVCVEAHAHVPNAEAEGGREELAANDCWITVTNGYWQLMQKAGDGSVEPLQNMLPSDLVANDPVNLNPVPVFISQSGDQPDTQGLRYRLEWDQEAVQIMAEGVGPDAEKLSYDAETEDAAYSAASGFTVTRQNRHETYLNLIAELPELNENGEQVLDEDGNECYYEVTRCEWRFDELDYNIWFEELRGDGNTWVFTDEEYALELNVSNMADKLADGKYALDVTVGVYEEAENGATLVDELTADTAEAAGCYQVSGPDEKGIVTVKLHGAALAKKVYGDDLQGSGLPEGQWLEFHASLLGIENAETNDREPLCYDDGTPIDACTGLGVLKPMLRLEDAEPGYLWMLLGGGYRFDGTADNPTVKLYPQNHEYPRGDQEFEAAVSAIEITNLKNEDGSEPEVLKELVLEGKKFLYANECGWSHVKLTLSCPELSAQDMIVELDVEVEGKAYEVNLESSTGTENLLKGKSLTLLTTVYLLDGEAEGENRYTEVAPENYSIEYWDYDPNLIQINDGVVTAVPKETNENYYGTDVRVQVSIPQGDGADDWVVNRWFHIEVCEQYCVLQASPLTAGAGDELTPDQFDPKLYMISEEQPEVTENSEPLKNANFWFHDSSDWGIASFNDEGTGCVVDAGWEPGIDRNVQIYIGGSYMDAYGDPYEGFGMSELTVCGHQIQKTEAVKPTCTEGGNVEYYYCEKCDRYFGDEACMEELDPDSLVLAAAGHKLAKVAAKPATCTTDGNLEHYHCSVCNKNYSDAAGTKELKNVKTAAAHKLAKVAAKSATCTTAGNREHYHCSVCGKNYSDAAGTKVLSSVTVAAAHKLAKVAAKPATCTTAGNKEHYHCSVCNKNYSDAAGTKELSDVKVAAGHKLAYVAATADQVEHYNCSVCGKNFSDKSGTTELTSIEVPVKPVDPEKPTDPVTPPETHTHTWGEWTTVSAATVFAPEQRQHTCGTCGVTETQAVGAALTPTMTVPANSLKMKVKQSTKKFVVTNMAEGDSVASMVSSSTKRLKVVSFNADGTCTLKAGKKTGKAKLTITLASGLTKTVTFKIQKAKVKTTSVKLAEKKLTLKKGEKLPLEPLIRPITSQDKVKYTSSNKKIVTVSSKGKLTAKKAGKAKITIRSGKKKVVCTVTVTN